MSVSCYSNMLLTFYFDFLSPYVHHDCFVLHCFLCIFSEKPREFLIEKLEQLKLSQQSGVIGPNLFDDSNLDVVFRIMDPDNKQYITFVQYKQGEC